MEETIQHRRSDSNSIFAPFEPFPIYRFTTASASVSVNAKGKLGASGFLELVKGSGNLEIALGSSVFSGKISTVTLLYP